MRLFAPEWSAGTVVAGGSAERLGTGGGLRPSGWQTRGSQQRDKSSEGHVTKHAENQ